MSLHPAHYAELSKASYTEFFAVELAFPSGTARLLDGSATVSFGSRTFTGSHEKAGTLNGVDGLEDSLDARVGEVTIELLPPTAADAADLAGPGNQGAAVTIWRGAVNPTTGAVVGEPKLEFYGTLDVPTLAGDRNQRVLSWTVVGDTERFFDNDEGVRLSYAYIKSVWPDDEGGSFITAVQDVTPWGSEVHTPKSVTAITSPSSGGAGGGGGRPFDDVGNVQAF